MPIKMMLAYGCPHEFHFDLESLFYVLVWICLREDGPRWEGRYPSSNYVMKGSILQKWCGGPGIPEGPNEDAYETAGLLKKACVTDSTEFENRILGRLPKYFEPIRDLLIELRSILFESKLSESPEAPLSVEERKNPDRVFERYIDALGRARDRLPSDDVPYGAPADRTARTAATTCLKRNRDLLKDDSSDDSCTSEDSASAYTGDSSDHGSTSPSSAEEGGTHKTGILGSQSRKHPGLESTHSSKRRCTKSIRSVKRSRS